MKIGIPLVFGTVFIVYLVVQFNHVILGSTGEFPMWAFEAAVIFLIIGYSIKNPKMELVENACSALQKHGAFLEPTLNYLGNKGWWFYLVCSIIVELLPMLISALLEFEQTHLVWRGIVYILETVAFFLFVIAMIKICRAIKYNKNK